VIDDSVFSVLETTPGLLRLLIEAMPAASVEAAVDDGWSPRHALAHVLDTEEVIAGRIRRIVEQERPFIRSIDPPARLRDGGYLERGVESLLSELERRRAEDVAWLKTLTASQLGRVGEHDEAGEVSAADHAHQWAYHDLMHLKQITAMLQDALWRRMGNTRLFYPEDAPFHDG